MLSFSMAQQVVAEMKTSGADVTCECWWLLDVVVSVSAGKNSCGLEGRLKGSFSLWWSLWLLHWSTAGGGQQVDRCFPVSICPVLSLLSRENLQTEKMSNLPTHVDVLIIGAGPTGLGAAARLSQHHHQDWLLVEARDGPGGLAYTTTTPEGFLFDTGGHVIFSHYSFFDELINHAVGGAGPEHWNTRKRVSHVLCRNVWVPYPFQNNLSFLPLEDQETCLLGAIDATVVAAIATTPPANFDEWILRVMGEGIADLFMRPYNFKVWACPPSTMQCGWLGERVATVNAKQLVSDVLHKRAAAVQWGPNAMFRFPKQGGTGQIWKDVASKCMSPEKQSYGTRVLRIDTEKKEVEVELGGKEGVGGKRVVVKYNKLLNTMPLDQFLLMCDEKTRGATIDRWTTRESGESGDSGESASSSSSSEPPVKKQRIAESGESGKSGKSGEVEQVGGEEMKKNSSPTNTPPVGCEYSSSHIVGLGVRGVHEHGDKCWQYFPDDDCPFYRCTVFTNYSENHAPTKEVMLKTMVRGNLTTPDEKEEAKNGPYFSLMLEISESKRWKDVNAEMKEIGGEKSGTDGSNGGTTTTKLRLPQVVLETIQGCVNTGMIKEDDEVVSIHYERLEYGYPTPSLGRDAALEVALPHLKSKSIWSRGRFGAWKYEVANQDHSCMQGVEAVDNMLHGSMETTLFHPSIANKRGGKNEDIHFVPA